MTKRRTKGEGTIYQRKDGRWVGQYTVDTLDGVKRRTIYGQDRKDVRAKLAEAIANRDKGLVFDAQGLTVGEYLDRWLVAIEGTIGERTWKRHEMVVRLHVKPSIGRTKLAALTPLQVQSLYRAKSRTHLSPGSVKRIHTTLHKAMRQAVRWQMIPEGLQGRDKAAGRETGEGVVTECDFLSLTTSGTRRTSTHHPTPTTSTN